MIGWAAAKGLGEDEESMNATAAAAAVAVVVGLDRQDGVEVVVGRCAAAVEAAATAAGAGDVEAEEGWGDDRRELRKAAGRPSGRPVAICDRQVGNGQVGRHRGKTGGVGLRCDTRSGGMRDGRRLSDGQADRARARARANSVDESGDGISSISISRSSSLTSSPGSCVRRARCGAAAVGAAKPKASVAAPADQAEPG